MAAAWCLAPDSSFLHIDPFLFSLVTGCCYRLLENPTISHQKNRSTKEAIAHLLGVALVRYNHMLSKLPSTSLPCPACGSPWVFNVWLLRCDREDHPDATALWAPALCPGGSCDSVGNGLRNEEHSGRDRKVTPWSICVPWGDECGGNKERLEVLSPCDVGFLQPRNLCQLLFLGTQ